MSVYSNTAISTSVTWPALIEPIWQLLPGCGESLATWKRPDIGFSERLFIGAVLNWPKEQRPWGVVSWLSSVSNVSRPTLYAIGKWARTGLLATELSSAKTEPVQKPDSTPKGEAAVIVTSNRIKRTALTLMFPGGVSDRASEICLQAAFDKGRSPAFLSGLAHEAGKRAGEILKKVDHSALGDVYQARDELFVGREPILLMVEPHSLVITGLYATTDRDAETWGCVLLMTQDRKVQIKGLAEDGCIPYSASCRLAKVDAAIQKDVWHPLDDVRQTVRDMEREALRVLKAAESLAKQVEKQWDDARFTQWNKLDDQFRDLAAKADELRSLRKHLWDAMELVDWRNGEIRNRSINQWLAEETLKGIKALPHPRIQKLLERLESQFPEMLTFLNGIAEPLATWRAQAEQHFQDFSAAEYFQRSVARLWRLEHALRNGQKQFKKAATLARSWLAEWLAADPELHDLAEKLLNLLERTVRTSSAAENINSVLRPYFDRRRECTDLESRQLYLNLFVLWFNMHKFERGPRKGKSPYEIAGIDLGTDDWLTLLGYPPDNTA